MIKILVTGGAGYIGSHTVVELVNAGYTPVIVDNFCNSEKKVLDRLTSIIGHAVICHEGDCCDQAFMRDVFEKENDIVGVIHFAALKAVGESIEKPDLYHSNNIGSLEVLMHMIQKYDAGMLVFSSSACVYGEPDELPVTEDSVVKEPISPYGETKQMCEEMIEQAVSDGWPLRAIALRYFNPIGAHQSGKIGELPIGVPNNLVPFVTQTAAGILPELTVYGDDYNTPDGTAIRDYLHVVDLARAHVDALKYLEGKSEGGRGKGDLSFYEVFNLGTGKGNSVMEVIKTFEEVTGVKLKCIMGKRRRGDVESLYANCDKAEKELGWKTKLTLADALKDSWRWQCSLGLKGGE